MDLRHISIEHARDEQIDILLDGRRVQIPTCVPGRHPDADVYILAITAANLAAARTLDPDPIALRLEVAPGRFLTLPTLAYPYPGGPPILLQPVSRAQYERYLRALDELDH